MFSRLSSCILGALLSLTALSQAYAAGSSSTLYTDPHGAFSLRYPGNASVSAGGQGNAYNALIGKVDVSVALKESALKGTNLGGAIVSVGVSKDPAIVSACGSGKAATDETRAGTAVLNGVPFARFTSGDGGAGSIMNWTMYRAVHDGSCYEIVEWLSWGAFENYPAGTIKQFDSKKTENSLQAITQSFEFLTPR